MGRSLQCETATVYKLRIADYHLRIMYLRDISVYADEAIQPRFASGFVHWFHRESCCITELYRSLLRKRVVTADTAKVHLEFLDEDCALPSFRPPRLSVVMAKWPFDFSAHAEADSAGKKQKLLGALHSALVWIANDLGWDAAAFETIRAEATARNLALAGWSKKSCLSPDRKYRAKVGFNWELRTVDFFAGVFDRRGREVGRKRLGTAVPEMGRCDSFLRSPGTWSRRNLFRLRIDRTSFELPDSWQVDLSDLLPAAEGKASSLR